MKFNEVFGEECRVAVIVYRRAWGTTPWTRIEATTIRNRAYNESYDLVVLIPLDKPPSKPKWLPTRTSMSDWSGEALKVQQQSLKLGKRAVIPLGVAALG